MKKKLTKQKLDWSGIAKENGDVIRNGKVIGKLYAPYTKSVLRPEKESHTIDTQRD